MMNYCKCGCGTVIAADKIYVRGHTWKGKKHSFVHRARMSASRLGKKLNFPITTIDWPWHISKYNSAYGTNFIDEKSLYLALYPGISISRIGRRLGVSKDTLYHRFDYYGVPRSHTPGGANNIKEWCD